MMPISNTPIYHITHVTNLESIIENGGLLCDSEMNRKHITCSGIAYQNLKDRRVKTMVPVAVKGMLADYVPFYLTNRSPMLGAIHSGQVAQYRSGQRKILHLVSSVQRVIKEGCEWCFTDGHAVEAMTSFYKDLDDLNKIDWDVIEDWHWGNTPEDTDRKRRKQAEFLVYLFFPWCWIEAIGVLDNEIALEVQSIVDKSSHRPLIKIAPKWYYKKKEKHD